MTENDYLNRYLTITEDFLNGSISRGEANDRLNVLNEEATNIRNKRTSIIGSHLAGYGDEYDAWTPSEICW